MNGYFWVRFYPEGKWEVVKFWKEGGEELFKALDWGLPAKLKNFENKSYEVGQKIMAPVSDSINKASHIGFFCFREFVSHFHQRTISKCNTHDDIDYIYDAIDHLCYSGRFDIIDSMVNKAVEFDVPLDIMLALLTATLPVRSKLKNRSRLYEAAGKPRGLV